MRERIQGVLIGLAAGDRAGGPTEMATRLAASLIDHRRFPLSDIGARYLDWWRVGAFDTGPITAQVLDLVDSGATYSEAAERIHAACDGVTAGCNPAHRSALLAMVAGLDVGGLVGFAKQEAELTHKHPLAGDVAAAVVSLCRHLIQGCPWRHALNLAANDRLPETRQALRQSGSERVGRGGYAPEALAAAVNFLSESNSFTLAMNRSLQFAGPAIYSPVLVGSIGGARWGAAAIPGALTAHCASIVHVRHLASELASLDV